MPLACAADTTQEARTIGGSARSTLRGAEGQHRQSPRRGRSGAIRPCGVPARQRNTSTLGREAREERARDECDETGGHRWWTCKDWQLLSGCWRSSNQGASLSWEGSGRRPKQGWVSTESILRSNKAGRLLDMLRQQAGIPVSWPVVQSFFPDVDNDELWGWTTHVSHMCHCSKPTCRP